MITELVRVLRPGGALTGSALLNDTGIRFAPIRVIGRATGLLGPGADSAALAGWLTDDGLEQVSLRTSGAIGYFRGVKGLSAPRCP